MTNLKADQWLAACYDAVLWWEETGLPIDGHLVATTRRHAATVRRILADPEISCSDRDAGLRIAELAGVA